MGSIEGRTLPIDTLNLFKQHKTPLHKHNRNDLYCVMAAYSGPNIPRAGDGDRTRDFLLGKEMLYH
jgi:hypothetical protein